MNQAILISGADYSLVRETLLYREICFQVRLLLPVHLTHRASDFGSC